MSSGFSECIPILTQLDWLSLFLSEDVVGSDYLVINLLTVNIEPCQEDAFPGVNRYEDAGQHEVMATGMEAIKAVNWRKVGFWVGVKALD